MSPQALTPVPNSRSTGASRLQPRGVPADVVLHERRYEVIAVVITGLAAKQQRDTGLRASVLEKLGAQLLGQELIGVAIVYQEIGKARTILYEGDSVMSAPGCARLAEISAQRF